MKNVNYTPEMTVEMVKAYSENPTAETVAKLAEKFGKSAASIRAKLSRENVYKAKEYATKKGEKPETKEAIVNEIAELLGKPAEFFAGLEKANKVGLNEIRKALK